MTEGAPSNTTDVVPIGARRLVAVALGLMLTAGVIGFEAWPLTAWRLFSLARDSSQTMWVIEAVDPDGDAHLVTLEELPLEYRHAAWPMAELPHASVERREEVCQALLEAARDVQPVLTSLRIVRDRQRLTEREGEWMVTHDPEVVHVCDRGSDPIL